jgi:hypothetical protein
VLWFWIAFLYIQLKWLNKMSFPNNSPWQHNSRTHTHTDMYMYTHSLSLKHKMEGKWCKRQWIEGRLQ